MKIGIWVNEYIKPSLGGGFSYFSRLVELIDNRIFPEGIEVCFISFEKTLEDCSKELIILSKSNIKLPFYERLLLDFTRQIYRFRASAERLSKKLKTLQNNHIKNQLKECDVDIIYYLSQMEKVVEDFPFIATNWDIGHLSMQPFPEITDHGELKRRNRWYNITLKKAISVFVESEAGKKELIDYLQFDRNKIRIVPLFYGVLVDSPLLLEEQNNILTNFGILKHNFFFYPAQYWEHKNHANLIKAFARFLKEYPQIKLVFSGSDKGNLQAILDLIEQTGISKSVFHLGFISNEELYTLYCNTIAMIMPTFLGPTNMPPLEARALGCPVLCSDFTGHREQLLDGALYFDPSSIDEILDEMKRIMDFSFRAQLLRTAQKNLEKSKFTGECAIQAIEEHFLAIKKNESWSK